VGSPQDLGLGKIFKREILCLLDTGASHNFVIRKSSESMELHLEELKAPIEVHFADGFPYPTTLQAKGVPLQLGNWRGKVELLVSVATPLWPSVGVNPNTPKVGDLESSGTPESLGFDSKAQNTSH
jgi:hypothetical protein